MQGLAAELQVLARELELVAPLDRAVVLASELAHFRLESGSARFGLAQRLPAFDARLFDAVELGVEPLDLDQRRLPLLLEVDARLVQTPALCGALGAGRRQSVLLGYQVLELALDRLERGLRLRALELDRVAR